VNAIVIRKEIGNYVYDFHGERNVHAEEKLLLSFSAVVLEPLVPHARALLYGNDIFPDKKIENIVHQVLRQRMQ
jgi:hypothetical protein